MKVVNASLVTDVFKSIASAPSLSFNAYSAGTSDTRMLSSSNTIVAEDVSVSKGWRVTAKNTNQAVNLTNLGTGAFSSGTLATGTTDLTAAMLGNKLSNTDVYVQFEDVRAASAGTYEAATSFTYVSFL